MSPESNASGSISTLDLGSPTQPLLTVIVSSSLGDKKATFPLPLSSSVVEVSMSIGRSKLRLAYLHGELVLRTFEN
jgi:hypothetical protein